MALVFDRRSDFAGQPGFHALIAGVSSYPHLEGGTGAPALNTFGMGQLNSAALTAYMIYRWLDAHQDLLAVPLTTCRLLLSPSATELSDEYGLVDLGEACTLENFLKQAAEWRRDATSHRDNLTLLYLVGHGLQMYRTDQIFLMENFGDGIGPALRNAVTVSSLFKGMTSRRPSAIARTQLYFFDASRVSPVGIEAFNLLNPTQVFDVDPAAIDDRSTLLFYAAEPGTEAYAIMGQGSLFGQALLRCLEGGAGELIEVDGEQRWCVTVPSLARMLAIQVDKLGRELGVASLPEVMVSGSSREEVISYLDRPPRVDVLVDVLPADALPFARLTVLDDQFNVVVERAAPLTTDPLKISLAAGLYTFRVSFDPASSEFRDQQTLKLAMPPETTVRLKLASS